VLARKPAQNKGKSSRLEQKARAERNRCGQRGPRAESLQPLILHSYPPPLYVVLATLVIGARNGSQPRSNCMTIRGAEYGFPRRPLLGNRVNRGNYLAPPLFDLLQ
jgi:hypothetical protein